MSCPPLSLNRSVSPHIRHLPGAVVPRRAPSVSAPAGRGDLCSSLAAAAGFRVFPAPTTPPEPAPGGGPDLVPRARPPPPPPPQPHSSSDSECNSTVRFSPSVAPLSLCVVLSTRRLRHARATAGRRTAAEAGSESLLRERDQSLCRRPAGRRSRRS